MSHFPVAVFHKPDQSIEELLAPYDENIKVKPYVEFTRREAIMRGKELFRLNKNTTDDDYWAMMADGRKTDKNGNIYSTYNPDSKWDWWETGGRFKGLLKVGNERKSSAKVKDIDFSPCPEYYGRAMDEWDVWVDKKHGDPKAFSFQPFSRKQLLDAYGNQENYAQSQAQFSTYAVVTPDGKWHSVGDMGWWGFSSETAHEAREWNNRYKERFIDTADPEWILTIVDCHI